MADKIEAVIEQFNRDRSNLVPVLNRVQEIEGYLSPAAITAISRFLDISQNEIYSVASFYPRFCFTPTRAGIDQTTSQATQTWFSEERPYDL